jgi:hypothetical protein
MIILHLLLRMSWYNISQEVMKGQQRSSHMSPVLLSGQLWPTIVMTLSPLTLAELTYIKPSYNTIGLANMIQRWMSGAPRRNWRDGYKQQITKLPVSFIFLFVFFLLLLLTFFLGANSVIRFPSAMVYSIAILDQSDFESIGRQMPSGTGVDASLADGTTNTKKRKRRGKYKKKDQHNGNNNDNNNLATMIEGIGNSESRITALRILIEFGTAEEKRQALAEVRSLAICCASANKHS